MALDLDPCPGVPFAQVLDVARWIRDELDALGAVGVPKTSGADGLHIYHSAAAGHAVRGRPALLPDRRDGRRAEASEGGDDRADASTRAASASTSTTCRTSSARRSRPPTARARATTPASRRRSRGRRWTTGVDREEFTIDDGARPARRRSAISGRRCGSRRASIWKRWRLYQK